MALHHRLIIDLTSEEIAFLSEIIREFGLNSLEEAIRELIHDAKWERAFANSQDVLDKLAEEALAEHKAGLTEEFDIDNETQSE